MDASDLDDVIAKLFKIGYPKVDLEKPGSKKFDTLVESFGQAANPPTKGVRKAFGKSLSPIGTDKSGGTYAEWASSSKDRPIVYFGSEGNTAIAASNYAEFVGLLAYAAPDDGWRLPDAMSYWRREITTLTTKKEKGKAATKHAVLTTPHAAIDKEVAAVLTAHNVEITQDFLDVVEEANTKYLWAFIDALDVVVTGRKVFRLWFDAWNRDASGEVRAYSPNEHYEIGERIRYTAKAPTRDVLGEGLVIGKPTPNRVLIADQHNTFVRACGVT